MLASLVDDVPALNQHWFNPLNTGQGPNADLMLGQRRRRWADIKPALFQRLVCWVTGRYDVY